MTPFAGDVTLTRIEDIAPGACASYRSFDVPGGSTMGADVGKRLVVTSSDARTWVVSFRAPAIPADLVQLGETLNLSIDPVNDTGSFSRRSQTFTLARNHRLLLFAATLSRYATRLSVPDVRLSDVTFADDGVVCQEPAWFGCTPVRHALRIIVGADSVSAMTGQSGRVGALSFAIDAFFMNQDRGNCDTPSFSQVVGFFPTAAP